MIDVLIILMGISMLYVFAASRIESFIKVLGIHGVLLFLIVLIDSPELTWLNLLFLSFETLIMKAIVIPYFLLKVIRRNEIGREVDPNVSQFYSLLIASIIFIFGFILVFWSTQIEASIRPLYFGVSISILISNLVLITIRKRLITHIFAYMMLENGIFLFSLSVAKEMPIIVNLGVLLDLFVGVFILAIFLNKIQTMFQQTDIDSLIDLKD